MLPGGVSMPGAAVACLATASALMPGRVWSEASAVSALTYLAACFASFRVFGAILVLPVFLAGFLDLALAVRTGCVPHASLLLAATSVVILFAAPSDALLFLLVAAFRLAQPFLVLPSASWRTELDRLPALLAARVQQLECDLIRATFKIRAQLGERLMQWRQASLRAANPEGTLIVGPVAVTPAWLTSTLRTARVLREDASVTSVKVDELSGNRGLAGRIVRLVVTYSSPDAVLLPNVGTTFMLKSTDCDTQQSRFRSIASHAAREALYYNSSLHDAKRDSTPGVYFAHGSLLFGDCVVLMQDMAGDDATGVNFFFGNQCWGMKPLARPRPAADVLRVMFEKAALLHASHWNDESLLQHTWLKSVPWYRGESAGTWQLAMDAARAAWLAARPAPGKETKLAFAPKMVAIIDAAFANSTWASLQASLRDRRRVPFALTHGDWHAANMMWKYGAHAPRTGETFGAEEQLVILDWSEVGVWEPTTDLAQTIISDVSPDVWRGGKDVALVQAYWNRLKECGVDVTTFSFDDCWAGYCRGGVERWLWIFTIMLNFPLPPVALQYFHDQLLAFIEDHELPQAVDMKSVPTYILKPVVGWVTWN